MSDIKSALIQYNAAMDALEQAEKAVQEALLAIKTVASAATVEVEGQFFQVRERKDKLYLCELNGKPRGRPKGSKNKRRNVVTEEVAAEPAALDFTAMMNTPDLPEEAEQTEQTETSDYVPEHTGVHNVDPTMTYGVMSEVDIAAN